MGEELLDGGTSGQIHTAVLENLELRMGCCKFFLWEVEFRKKITIIKKKQKKKKKRKEKLTHKCRDLHLIKSCDASFF